MINIIKNSDNSGNIHNIVGPVNVSHYIVGGKEIYMFGDFHGFGMRTETKNQVCIPEIFDLIIKCNPDVEIDFFLEDMRYRGLYLSNIAKEYSKRFDYLVSGSNIIDLFRTQQFFSVCRVSHTLCKKYWKNLRFHGVDVRNSNELMDFSSLFNHTSFEQLLNNVDYFVNKYIKDENYLKVFEIDLQITNIRDKNVRDFIRYYIINNNKKLTDIFMSKKTVGNFFNIYDSYVDYYTIGKLFRNFEDYETKYAIIYMGNNHRYFLNNFFKSLHGCISIECGELGSVDYRSNPNNKLDISKIIQSIDVTKLNLPFFKTSAKPNKEIIVSILKTNNYSVLNDFYFSKKSKLFGRKRKNKSSKRKNKSSKRKNKSSKRNYRIL